MTAAIRTARLQVMSAGLLAALCLAIVLLDLTEGTGIAGALMVAPLIAFVTIGLSAWRDARRLAVVERLRLRLRAQYQMDCDELERLLADAERSAVE